MIHKNNKKLDLFTIFALFVILILTIIFIIKPVSFIETYDKAKFPYENLLFNDKIAEINIDFKEGDFEKMFQEKESKPYYKVNATINGQEIKDIAIRPKGKSSLAASGYNGKMSYKLNFDYYDELKNLWGLKALILNNLSFDATYVQDWFAYDLFEHMQVPTPLRNYAFVSINNKPIGLYLMLEPYDRTWLKRNYKDNIGNMYKTTGNIYGKLDMIDLPDVDIDPETGLIEKHNGYFNTKIPEETLIDTAFENKYIKNTFQYLGNNSKEYQGVFRNKVFRDLDERAIGNYIRDVYYLNNKSYEEYSQYFNIDEIIRYFVVHNFLMNIDSYIGSSCKNFFTLERDGNISILPWDYNNLLGVSTFDYYYKIPEGTLNEIDKENIQFWYQDKYIPFTINRVLNYDINEYPVDKELTLKDRPLLNIIFTSEENLSLYHTYLQELITYYNSSGKQKLFEINKRIHPYILNEKIHFFSEKEQNKALNLLVELYEYRADSIYKQLNNIPKIDYSPSEDVNYIVYGEMYKPILKKVFSVLEK